MIQKNLVKVLRKKAFYVVIALAFLVNMAMDFNRTHHPDKLDEYYGTQSQKQSQVAKKPVRRSGVRADEIIRTARKYTGKPYKYAAKGPDAFDCSGFTSFVFKQHDITLSPSSRRQSTTGKLISKEDLRAGDLVFFKSPTKGNDQIGHVGIVTFASPESITFIHSSTRRGVIEDDLISSKHYSSRYRFGRRVL